MSMRIWQPRKAREPSQLWCQRARRASERLGRSVFSERSGTTAYSETLSLGRFGKEKDDQMSARCDRGPTGEMWM